jgi:hypothetical protein
MARYARLTGVFAAMLLVGLLLQPSRVATQTAAVVFGSSSGLPQAVKSTSNALWVSLQSVASVVTISLTNLITTSTDGLLVQNTTAATAGVPVQISPRIRLQGNAWDTAASQSVAFFVETLPATAATPTGTFKLGYSLNGAAATYPFTVSSAGAVTAALSGNFDSLNVSSVGFLRSNAFGNRLTLPADGLQRFVNNASTFTAEFNTGTAAPTVANCSVGTTGTITTKSTNLAGEVNPGSGSTSCDVTFGAPAWTNAPFCVVTNETTEGQGIISARTTLLFTISGFTAGDKFTWVCIGG